ncbi:SETMR methyltransferase, partial [Acromyrmex heyeri]
MQQVYSSQCLGRTAVFEWHKHFLEGRETLEDDKKSGRPILVRTPEIIEKVRDFVANDRNASLKMMEEALNISRETIRTILHEDLGKTKVCAKFVPHTLRSDQKSARINYSRDIVAAAENNPNFLKSIVTGDETWCFQYDLKTKRQSAEWKSKNSRKVPSKIKTMLITFFDSKGIIHKEFEHNADIRRSTSEMSVVSHHQLKNEMHELDWDNIRILDTEQSLLKRSFDWKNVKILFRILSCNKTLISETLHIKKQKNDINLKKKIRNLAMTHTHIYIYIYIYIFIYLLNFISNKRDNF